MNHLSLAHLCRDMYEQPPAFWDHYHAEDGGVVFGHMRIFKDIDVVVFRGSVTKEDWMDNLRALPRHDKDLGWIHGGFLDGTRGAFEELTKHVGEHVVLTGHSLGGAHAWITAGRFALSGKPVKQVTVFGAPRPGFQKLADIIKSGGSVNTAYRNHHDPIVAVPYLMGLYRRPVELTQLRSAHRGDTPIADHFISRYIAGLSAAGETA